MILSKELETKEAFEKLKQKMKRKGFYKNSSYLQQQQKHCVVSGAFIFSFSSFIIDSFNVRTQHCSKFFTLLCAVLFLPTIQPKTFPLEAAFQGKINFKMLQ